MRSHASLLAALPLFALLAACGGGGGGVASTPVPPTVVPPPPPPPPPPPAAGGSFDTAEYRRSNGAVRHGALVAWNSGNDGRGVLVGVVDSGIDANSAEFAGRIDPRSADTSGANRGIGDEDGHGTMIAGLIGAARNDAGIVGIAPAATLLIARADIPGSCATDCRFSSANIAAGFDLAARGGARAVNVSLGGNGGSVGAMAGGYARAGAAGVVVVISAGNDSMDRPTDTAVAGLDNAGARQTIIVGALGPDGELASFANRAGATQNNYIAALGVDLRVVDHLGQTRLVSGASGSAPLVTGAVALLAQAFPNLSGAQIVELLLRTADDAGAPGTDPVFGRGVLNIARAVAPVGGTFVAGTGMIASQTLNGSLGAPMGDGAGLAGGLGLMRVRDEYSRDYALDAARTLRGGGAGRLAGALLGPETDAAFGAVEAGGARASLWASAEPAGFATDLERAGLTARPATRAAATMMRLSVDGTEVAAARGFGAAALLPGAAGRHALTSDDALDGGRALGTPTMALALGRRIAGFDVGVAAASRRGAAGFGPELRGAGSATEVRLAAVRRFGPVTAAAQLGRATERGSLLGTRLAPWLGLMGGDAVMAGGALGWDVGDVRLRAAATRGWWTPRAGAGLLEADGALTTSAWSMAGEWATGAGLFTASLAQPLRLDGGSMRLRLPGEDARALPFAPSGREVAAEMGWAAALPGGRVEAALFRRTQPGHALGAADDVGGAVRLRLGW